MSKKRFTFLLVISTLLLLVFLLLVRLFTNALASSIAQVTSEPSPTPLPSPTAMPTEPSTPDLPPQLDFATSGWHSVLQKQGAAPAKEGASLLLGVIPGGKETVIYHACLDDPALDGTATSYEITIGPTIEGYVYCNTPPPGEMSGEGSFDIAASRLSTASSYPVRVVSTGEETPYMILIGQPD